MHKHHILPRSAGGTDNPENIIPVSVEEHTEIHRCLWIYGGRWQDEYAWKLLSGQIGRDECMKFIRDRARIKAHTATRGKTYEEIYGEEEAILQRKKRGPAISKALKGKSYKKGSDTTKYREAALRRWSDPQQYVKMCASMKGVKKNKRRD